jgi:hypothetical protein
MKASCIEGRTNHNGPECRADLRGAGSGRTHAGEGESIFALEDLVAADKSLVMPLVGLGGLNVGGQNCACHYSAHVD